MELTAIAMLPFDDADRARAALRCRLQEIVERRQIPEAALEGAKMLVAGPTVSMDAAGRRWFEWVATLRIDASPAAGRRVDSLRPTPRSGGAAWDDPWDDVATDDPAPRLTVNDLGLLRRRAG